MRIILDLDDCTYDFEGAFRDIAEGLGYYEIPDVLFKDYSRPGIEWGLDLEEFKRICDYGVDNRNLYGRRPPLPGVQEGVAELVELGHSLHWATRRLGFGKPGRAAIQTHIWLDEYNLHADTVTLGWPKTILGGDIAIEDSLEGYYEFWNVGIRCALMDRPHNSGGDPVDRVYNFGQFVEMVKEVDR